MVKFLGFLVESSIHFLPLFFSFLRFQTEKHPITRQSCHDGMIVSSHWRLGSTVVREPKKEIGKGWRDRRGKR